jgi:hypothetical protein
MRRDDRVYRESVQAFVVGKDFGAMPAYDFALRHPGPHLRRGVPFVPFSPPRHSTS